MVCLGNPPYNRQTIDEDDLMNQKRKGGWVRFGDDEQKIDENEQLIKKRPILEDFLEPLTAMGDGVHAKNLYNDYVSVDRAFKQAINSGDTSTGYKLADKWRIAQNTIDQEYENLLELLGLALDY